jgi:hypothetical protein
MSMGGGLLASGSVVNEFTNTSHLLSFPPPAAHPRIGHDGTVQQRLGAIAFPLSDRAIPTGGILVHVTVTAGTSGQQLYSFMIIITSLITQVCRWSYASNGIWPYVDH